MPTISGLKGAQIETELQAFIDVLLANDVTSYLEIGGKFGDTFYRVMTSLPPGSRGVLVDLPPNDRRKDLLVQNFRYLDYMGSKVQLILGNSHDQTTIAQIVALGPFDACLIDGDRTHQGIMMDFLNFQKMCRIQAFHDIRAAGAHLGEAKKGMTVEGEEDMAAPAFWRKLCAAGYKTLEIADLDEHVGIGVVFH